MAVSEWTLMSPGYWPKSQLSTVATTSVQKKFHLAVSNPCFELWLLLHHEDVAQGQDLKCGEVGKRLKKLVPGFSKTKLGTSDFYGRVPEAISRARSLDTNTTARWPQKVGTRVYLLAEEILKMIGDAEG